MKRTDEEHVEKKNAAFSRRVLCYFVSPAFIKLCFIWTWAAGGPGKERNAADRSGLRGKAPPLKLSEVSGQTEIWPLQTACLYTALVRLTVQHFYALISDLLYALCAFWKWNSSAVGLCTWRSAWLNAFITRALIKPCTFFY